MSRFIGEESAGEESVHEEHIDDSFTWVVDPIDGNWRITFILNLQGTTNFVHGIPDVSISIGFMIVARPVVGVVLNPFTAHLYTAIRGAGSYETILSPDLTKVIERHKLPLFPITRLSLDTSVIGLNVGYDRTKNLGVKTRTWHRLLSARGGMVRGIRIFQSTALEMCAVARGSIDAFWGGGSSIWDICAGWIIVNESGGMIADGNRPAHPDQLEKIEEPSLKGKLLLAVRQGQTKEQMDSFAREFWGMIEGRLDYSE